ncbi:MAG: hypothetical protein PHD76_14655 [Methylacidiphilales bacterium]|nr:hypothetical protein [Candidatus Methylacidiphilales bacterium]
MEKLLAEGNNLDLGLDTGAAHTTIPLFSGSKPVTTPKPIFGAGEGATLSIGTTYNF